MTFELFPLRFHFTAIDPIHFPPGKSANILRGALGSVFRRISCSDQCTSVSDCGFRDQCAYATIFEPSAMDPGPSGFSDWPRPFVFRARHLDGRFLARGEAFYFDLNVFAVNNPAIAYFALTFAEIAREGMGPRRGRAQFVGAWQLSQSREPTLIHNGDSLRFTNAPGGRNTGNAVRRPCR